MGAYVEDRRGAYRKREGGSPVYDRSSPLLSGGRVSFNAGSPERSGVAARPWSPGTGGSRSPGIPSGALLSDAILRRPGTVTARFSRTQPTHTYSVQRQRGPNGEAHYLSPTRTSMAERVHAVGSASFGDSAALRTERYAGRQRVHGQSPTHPMRGGGGGSVAAHEFQNPAFAWGGVGRQPRGDGTLGARTRRARQQRRSRSRAERSYATASSQRATSTSPIQALRQEEAAVEQTRRQLRAEERQLASRSRLVAQHAAADALSIAHAQEFEELKRQQYFEKERIYTESVDSSSAFGNDLQGGGQNGESPNSPVPVWKCRVDPSSGSWYYAHALTNETTWEEPPSHMIILDEKSPRQGLVVRSTSSAAGNGIGASLLQRFNEPGTPLPSPQPAATVNIHRSGSIAITGAKNVANTSSSDTVSEAQRTLQRELAAADTETAATSTAQQKGTQVTKLDDVMAVAAADAAASAAHGVRCEIVR